MRTTLAALVCAVVLSACAWGESSTPGGDDPKPDASTQQAVCGDGVCAPAEVGNCSADCGGSTGPVCGNGSCENGENNASCPADCPPAGPICGDNVCDMAGGENSSNCPGDCSTQGGNLDCNDQNVLLGCFACLLDPALCAPPLTEQACLTCLGP
jgi:hypothetical protein